LPSKEDRIAGRNRKEMRWIDENVGGEETGGVVLIVSMPPRTVLIPLAFSLESGEVL
jgi:hypothetical protein